MRFSQKKFHSLIAVFFYAAGVLLALTTARFLAPILLPFLIALGIAALLHRPALAVANKTGLSRRFVAAFMAILFALTLFALLFHVMRTLFSELGELIRTVMNGESALITNLQAFISRLNGIFSRIPLVGQEATELRNVLSDALIDTVKSAVATLGAKLPEFAARLASTVPQGMLFCVVTLLSCVYFCMDYDGITAWMRKSFGAVIPQSFAPIRRAVCKTTRGFFRSYAALFFCTFVMLLIGFLILKEPYALLLSAVTALVDGLPVFGIGIVLLPMALYRFFVGDGRAAVGFCILYAVITIARQILEPKLISNGIGLHPLLTLLATYAGLRLFGIAGMILLPPAFVIVKNILQETRHIKTQ